MQASASPTEFALSLLLVILSLAPACWLARYPRRTSIGIALGVVVGVVLLNLSSGLVAFSKYVFPFGQIDFWLANFLNRIFGWSPPFLE